MNIIYILKHYTDYVIFGTLIIMSIVMFYKVIERYAFYKKITVNNYNTLAALELDMTKGLTPIYTVGAIAPYVGLLGTIIGILITFYDMGQAGGNIDSGKIMSGLALALKATAAGIFVAMPSVAFYNSLTTKVEHYKLAWQSQS